AELDREALYWEFTPAHLAAIDELMAKIEAAGIPFHEIRRQHFSHPALDADLAALLAHIKSGPGLVIMRGFPVDKYDAERMQAVYWGIGTHFGHGCSQSADGDYLGHVTNVEKASRGYTTSRELNLHTDSAEIVGLLCVRDARQGGLSIYASSLKVYEIIAREHPEYLAVLERGFRCDRRGEEAPEDEPVTPYRVPVFSTQDGILSGRYVRGVIDKGAGRRRRAGRPCGGAPAGRPPRGCCGPRGPCRSPRARRPVGPLAAASAPSGCAGSGVARGARRYLAVNMAKAVRMLPRESGSVA